MKLLDDGEKAIDPWETSCLLYLFWSYLEVSLFLLPQLCRRAKKSQIALGSIQTRMLVDDLQPFRQ